MQQVQCVRLVWRKCPRNIFRVGLDVRLVGCFAWAKVVFKYFVF